MATKAGKSLQQRRWRQRQLFKLGLTEEEYYRSTHWQVVRRQKLAAQQKEHGYNFCERCGVKQPEPVARETALHVHHLTYERLGEELLEDLQLICRPCHEKEHGHDRKGRNFRPGERS